jgi:pyruvate-formate lyase-activating enzyme
MIALAYCDRAGRVYYDGSYTPLADGGVLREPSAEEMIAAPPGTVQMILPGRRVLTTRGSTRARYALAAMLPAGYTRLLVPAFDREPDAPALPLFGYTFAAAIDDRLFVAAMKTDEGEDWQPRRFGPGELEAILERRVRLDPNNAVLAQVARCSREYGCFTAQNVFLERGEAALPVSPRCNARCVGCISEQEPDAGIPSPQARITYETTAGELARIAVHHLERVEDGIVSFGQGCEGEPLLRSIAIAAAIQRIRASRSNGTINLNTNGSLPRALERCIDAGLQAVRISLNSFRSRVYAAYYRPIGYDLDDVLASVRLAAERGLQVSLNLLTHPGVSDDEEEIDAMCEFLSSVRVRMIQTRTLNIDPEVYFAAAGRPKNPAGMHRLIGAIKQKAVAVGNFTHTH